MKADLSLVTLKLKQRIVEYLENQYRRTGTNDAISWRGIWIESGLTEEEFREALNAAAETEIVFADSDHIRLRSAGRLSNKPQSTNTAPSNGTAPEQFYGRAVNLIRLFLQFGKKQSAIS